jgi:carboxyl-terminal processing protease
MKTIKFRALTAFLVLAFLPGALSAQVSPSDRLKIFERVWRTVNEKYYDPNFNGTDWNRARATYRPLVEAANDEGEFYSLIKQMVGDLGDIHTSFRTPQEVIARKRGQTVGTGLWLGEAEGETVILGVAKDSEAARLELKPGMILKAVDGRPAADVLAERRARINSSSANAVSLLAYSRLLNGAEDSSVSLSLIDLEGQPKEVTLTRKYFDPSTLTAPQFSARLLPSGIGYIRFDEFNDSMTRQYKKALAELKASRGLVIDLRFNHGGSHYAMEDAAAPLLAEKISFGTIKTRTGKMPKFLGISLLDRETFVGGDSKQLFSAPVVILTSRYSASAAEHFAAALQESGRVKILGEQSCGCMLGIMGKTKIKGGELYVSQLDFLTAKGNRLEGAGVAPDVFFAPTIEDVRRGNSLAIIEAEKLLDSVKK